MLAVKPGGAHDVAAIGVELGDQFLTERFASTVGRDGVDGGIFGVGGGRGAVEDVVGGVLHQGRTDRGRRLCKVSCARAVDGGCPFFVSFGIIDGGVGGGVDDDVVAGDGFDNRGKVGDIEVGASERGDVTTGQHCLEVPAEHARGTSDQIATHDFLPVCGGESAMPHPIPPRSDGRRATDSTPYSAARSFNGSHHERLSRYHCTTSARPCSKGTWGS